VANARYSQSAEERESHPGEGLGCRYRSQRGRRGRASHSVRLSHRCRVSLGQERLQTRTIIWAAGVKASPAGEWLNAECDRAGRVKVLGDLSVPGYPNVFVIGDAAAATTLDGRPLPGVATVAKQQGSYVANLLTARAEGRTLHPFRYRDVGSIAP